MRTRSLLGQIVVSAGSGVLAFVGIWTAAAVLWMYAGALASLEQEADSQSEEIAAAIAPLLWNLDTESIEGYLNTKARHNEFVEIVVRDPSGGHMWTPTGARPSPGGMAAPTAQRKASILYAGQEIGELSLTLTLAPRQRQVAETILSLVLSLILLFLAILGSIMVSWRGVSTRLQGMVSAMERFAAGAIDQRMPPDRSDDLGILAAGFNAMANRIEANTRSMEKEIKVRTEKLMESEKLALVGSLVAGVAHEINTPIGNGITITSWLATRTAEIREAEQQGGPEPAVLSTYLTDVESTLGILQSGLDRTSNLIQTFKKIGADQVVDERRPVQLRSFLEEVVASLLPTLKRFPHTIQVHCPDDLTIVNHPGALFQIVTNLVLNAHHHGFSETDAGTIELNATSLDRDTFELVVKDNGRGIDAEILARIFEPFFTTKRRQGGTGLGLSIVRSLAQNLGGTVTASSEPGRGATFVVTLPKTAPNR